MVPQCWPFGWVKVHWATCSLQPSRMFQSVCSPGWKPSEILPVLTHRGKYVLYNWPLNDHSAHNVSNILVFSLSCQAGQLITFKIPVCSKRPPHFIYCMFESVIFWGISFLAQTRLIHFMDSVQLWFWLSVSFTACNYKLLTLIWFEMRCLMNSAEG